MSLLRSGGVFYGGLIAAVVVCIYQLRKHKLPLWTSGDLFAPGIALGYMVGRLGCLMAGCCYGRPTDVGWAITFTDPAAAINVGTPLNVPLHPTQLYESAAGLVIFLLLMAFERRGRPFPGRTFWMFVLLYAVSRFIIEFYRGDDRGAGVRHGLDVAGHLAGAGAAQPVHAVVSRQARSAGRSRDAARPAKAAFRVTHLNFVVPPDSAGERLDRFLAGEVPNYSRSQIQRLIDDGQVVVARVKVTKSNVQLREGDEIAVTLPDTVAATPAAQDLPVEILFDDDDLVVVNKPAGMVVHPAAGNPDGTLVNALLHHVKNLSGIGGEARPGIVHRLDKGTSGVMVVAKNDVAHRELSRQFHDREIEKEYVALVWGLVQQRKRIEAVDRPRSEEPSEDVDARLARARRR